MAFWKLQTVAKFRRYKFADHICAEVLQSMQFKKDGSLYKMKAVCSDGVIRSIRFDHKKQKKALLEGYVQLRFNYTMTTDVYGYVDTSDFAKKLTNVGVAFIHYNTTTQWGMLPSWQVPGWSMPGRVAEIR